MLARTIPTILVLGLFLSAPALAKDAEPEEKAPEVKIATSKEVKHELKIRQPLCGLTMVTRNAEERAFLKNLSHLVQEELNVKEVHFTENEDDLVHVSAKANFRELGKRLGKDTPKIAGAIAKLDTATIRALEAGETRMVEADGVSCEITIDDLVLQRQEREGLLVENDGTLTVGLETELTPELIAEGLAREFVSKLQAMRKEAGLEISDRIHVRYAGDDELDAAFAAHRDYILGEVLGLSLEQSDGGSDLDINGRACKASIEKA